MIVHMKKKENIEQLIQGEKSTEPDEKIPRMDADLRTTEGMGKDRNQFRRGNGIIEAIICVECTLTQYLEDGCVS